MSSDTNTLQPGRKPPQPGPLRAAIQAAREAGNHTEALELLRAAAAAQPKAAWPVLDRAVILRESGDRDGAMDAIRSVLARDETLPKAWMQLGLLERANGRPDAALAAFERAASLDPDAVEPTLQLAQECFNLGQQARSDALLARALELDRDGVQALAAAAQRAMMANAPASALPLFEQAMARCPWHVPAYIGACNALIKLGRAEDAMAALDQGIAQCGSRPGLHARRAQLLRDMGFYAAALSVAQAGLAQHADSFLLWETVMRLLLMCGGAQEMQDWLEQARPARDTERATLLALRGDVALELGRQGEAIRHYTQALALQPTAARHHGALAVACLTSFDIDAAAAHVRQQTDMTAPALRLKSRSDNPANSYYGQIINEYRLDPDTRAALARLPPSGPERIERLCRLNRRYPDSTLLAAALLDALWRDGAIGNAPGAAPGGPGGGAESPIPRRIAQFWDSAPPPADVAVIMRSWAEQNPDFEHQVFDDLAARAFLAAHHGPDILQAYHRAGAPAMKADLFRLAVLAVQGGVYADADDRCLVPLAQILAAPAELVLYRENLGTLGNNFLAAVPGHALILAALRGAATAINRGDQDILWLATGPGLITRSFAQLLANDPDHRAERLRLTHIWPRRQMLRRIAIHCIAGYKDTAQHWVRAAFTAQ